jgi:amidophosphoribosyltransferase
MPTRSELIAYGRTNDEIAAELGADHLIYQTVEGMNRAILAGQERVTELEESCFTGEYLAGRVDDDYLDWLEITQES